MKLSRELQSAGLQQEAEALAAGLPPLQVEAERLAASVSLGVHGRRKSGMGESFWQFRRYGAEDAASSIDWRQSGKSQNLYVREREWEAAQAVWFWRDGSPTMQYRSDYAALTKAEAAGLLTLAASALLLRGGERVALAGSERPPSSARSALTRMAYELSDGLQNATLPPHTPVSSHGRFVWLSDFLEPLDQIVGALERMAAHNVTGHFVHILDPAEEIFPFEGRTRFESVLGSESELLGRAESVRNTYRARFRAHTETLSALARRFGWTYLSHRTDADPAVALIALYSEIAGQTARRTP